MVTVFIEGCSDKWYTICFGFGVKVDRINFKALLMWYLLNAGDSYLESQHWQQAIRYSLTAFTDKPVHTANARFTAPQRLFNFSYFTAALNQEQHLFKIWEMRQSNMQMTTNRVLSIEGKLPRPKGLSFPPKKKQFWEKKNKLPKLQSNGVF